MTSSPRPVLSYFDPGKARTLQVHASQNRLGAALMQECRPIAYASKSLTSCERNYAKIEKEVFVILFDCRSFHHSLYGRKVTTESDHKPLIPIF